MLRIAKFEFSLFGINTYVVYEPQSGDCVIIDPGMSNSRERDALVNFINMNNLKVTNIINTHLHVDHAIGDSFARGAFKVPVKAHRDDESLGRGLGQQAMMFGIGEDVEDVSIDSYLEEGDVIKIGGGELKVLHVPGHSPGGIALYDEEDKFVIVGDSLFNGSVGRSDLPGGNHFQLIKSIRRKLMSLPDDTVVYPGHGPATTIGQEKTQNPYL